MKEEDYSIITVETYKTQATSGLHGEFHVRPIKGQDPFLTTMQVECSRELLNDYPMGTKFRIKAKITTREGGRKFIYSNYNWTYTVL